VQEANVIDDTGKVFVLNSFTTEHNDKGFAPMGINIGDRVAKSLHQFGSTFLYHG
jgi:hypothetical protein